MPRRALIALALPVMACGGNVARDAGRDSAAVDGCGPDASPGTACPVCTPGATDCTPDAAGTRRCNADGLGWTDVASCDASLGQLCTEGACVDPCPNAAATHSYQGCEFYAVGLIDSTLAAYDADVSIDDFPYAVALTNPWPVPVTATLEGGGLGGPLTATLAPRGAAVIPLPWVRPLCMGVDPDHSQSALVTQGAVHVRTSAPVGAYQFNPRGYTLGFEDTCVGRECWAYSNDASLLLPVAALRTQYVAITRPTVRVRSADDTQWRLSSGFIAVVGVGPDPADVTVTLRGTTAAGPGIDAQAPGAQIHRRLGPGDVLQLLSANDPACASPEPDTVFGDVYCAPVATEDLTGSFIESSAPVSVFSGHNCALVPYNRFACDHLEEQLFPLESLGMHYVVARTPPVADEPDLLRVVSTRVHTTVTFTPASVHAPVVLDDAGDDLEFEIREPVEVTADQPIEVGEFLVGAHYDPSVVFDRVGDPDLVLSAPVDQYRNAYQFVAEEGFGTSTAIAVVPHAEALRLDGTPVVVAPVASVGGYDVLYIPVAEGPHALAAEHGGIRFGLTVSGLALYASYSYPGGLDLAPISPPR